MKFASRKTNVLASGVFCGGLLFSGAAMAEDANAGNAPHGNHSDKYKSSHSKVAKSKTGFHAHSGAHAATGPVNPSGPPGLSPGDVAIAEAMAKSPARFDKVYGFKGWDVNVPSAGDSLSQDYGGYRSALASYGFGLFAFNTALFQWNMLNTPIKVPQNSYVPSLGTRLPYPACTLATAPICAGKQVYAGQRPFITDPTQFYITYDLSQWGVPNGQLQIGGVKGATTYNDFSPKNALSLLGLSWYQTLLDGKVELQIGYISNYPEWIGTFVGGNIFSPFGPSAGIQIEMGMTVAPVTAPAANFWFHLTDRLYNQVGVQRSSPINGPTGNTVLDETNANPAGFRFTEPRTGLLVMDEIGYKNDAAPNDPRNWYRFGVMYNTSAFADYSQLLTNPTATHSGVGAMYFLADRQIWQQAPDSVFSAYRGIYVGGTAMYMPPEYAVFSQYYEGRVYWFGPFDTRPFDVISVVYAHNGVSHNFANAINSVTAPLAAAGFPVTQVRNATNSITASYTAKIIPGVYATAGIGYTDNPSPAYFSTEGHSLNFLSGLVVNF